MALGETQLRERLAKWGPIWPKYVPPEYQPNDGPGRPVTEPGTFLLLGTSLLGLGYAAWQRREEEFETVE